jgi:hypothetical protein
MAWQAAGGSGPRLAGLPLMDAPVMLAEGPDQPELSAPT